MIDKNFFFFLPSMLTDMHTRGGRVTCRGSGSHMLVQPSDKSHVASIICISCYERESEKLLLRSKNCFNRICLNRLVFYIVSMGRLPGAEKHLPQTNLCFNRYCLNRSLTVESYPLVFPCSNLILLMSSVLIFTAMLIVDQRYISRISRDKSGRQMQWLTLKGI